MPATSYLFSGAFLRGLSNKRFTWGAVLLEVMATKQRSSLIGAARGRPLGPQLVLWCSLMPGPLRRAVVLVAVLPVCSGVVNPLRHPQICNSNKTKLSCAGTGSAKQVSADLPLLQHVAPKTQRPKIVLWFGTLQHGDSSAKTSLVLQIARKSS